MATVQKFEDLLCWQKARELTREVYKVLALCKDFGFKDQIQRASVSVMSNIAEGLKANRFAFNGFCRSGYVETIKQNPGNRRGGDFDRGTKQEFLNYLYIAKASAGEVRAQVYAAHDIGYLNIETFKYLKTLAEDCSRLIASFIKGLKGSQFSGIQHKREVKKDAIKSWIEDEKKRQGIKFVWEK